ncbi:hypothetical protein AERO8C_20747 [Aeromonas veronii]|uniref:Uncharacterized protein n=1 Tax=Aeromonas veronii TaxID=654 RepID=A0A653L3A6_AERVE|nr:hypothetical protein AERO8C_20747 [Aeromonas veronii]
MKAVPLLRYRLLSRSVPVSATGRKSCPCASFHSRYCPVAIVILFDLREIAVRQESKTHNEINHMTFTRSVL